MNASTHPALSDTRLARLSLWLVLTIAYFVSHVLAHVAPKHAARVLTAYAHTARLLLVARAVTRAALPRNPRTHRPVEAHRLTCRRVFGARLRRRMRKGTLAQRARALCALLAAPERCVAATVRRLRRRFTKLRRLPAPRRVIGICAGVQPRFAAKAINSS
jgi:hypothetical protein